jgi:hypothetical protein
MDCSATAPATPTCYSPAKDVYACGCAAAADCPPGYACNTATNTCVNGFGSCAYACNGCCAPGAYCYAGTQDGACGPVGGNCTNCTISSAHVCIASVCGCNSGADCATGYACKLSTHTCVNGTGSCGSGLDCNGCCKSGACQAGTSNTVCGAGGKGCNSCVAGTMCKSGGCCVISGEVCTDGSQCCSGSCTLALCD